MPQLHVSFPPEAQFDEIATALAIAAGAKFHFNEVSGVPCPQVDTLTTVGCVEVPSLALLSFVDGAGDKVTARYHFEFGPGGRRGMLLRDTPFWLAVSKAVVERFGGRIETEDSPSRVLLDVESRWPADPEETGFAALKDLVLGVRRITAADLKAAEQELKLG